MQTICFQYLLMCVTCKHIEYLNYVSVFNNEITVTVNRQRYNTKKNKNKLCFGIEKCQQRHNMNYKD